MRNGFAAHTYGGREGPFILPIWNYSKVHNFQTSTFLKLTIFKLNYFERCLFHNLKSVSLSLVSIMDLSTVGFRAPSARPS